MEATARSISFSQLVEQHLDQVWRYLRVLGCDHGQADDLAQETFLVLARRDLEDRGPAALDAYLRRRARGLLLRELERSRRRQAIAFAEEAHGVWERSCRDGSDQPYRAALHACLEALGSRSREAVLARYAEGLDRQAIARRLRLTPGGVKTLLRRTRDKLRRCIEGRIGR